MQNVAEITAQDNAQLELFDYYTTQEVDCVVALGHKDISDTQRYVDEWRGGFAAMVCGYSR